MMANTPVHEANRPGFTLERCFFYASQSGSTHSSRQWCRNMAHAVKSHRGENERFFLFFSCLSMWLFFTVGRKNIVCENPKLATGWQLYSCVQLRFLTYANGPMFINNLDVLL